MPAVHYGITGDIGGDDRHQHHLLGNDARFYFGTAALRPFLGGALDADYYYYRLDYYPYYQRDHHIFVVFVGFGGGVELNYDPRGSFFDVRAFAGPAARWFGGPESNFRMLTYFSFYTGNVIYFNRHVGLDVHLAADAETGYYAENRVVLEMGRLSGGRWDKFNHERGSLRGRPGLYIHGGNFREPLTERAGPAGND